MMVNNFRNNFKDYNLTLSEANKRYKVYEQLLNEKNTLKRNYDALFAQKSQQRDLLSSQHSERGEAVLIRGSSSTRSTTSRP
jgi:hypothetical protein